MTKARDLSQPTGTPLTTGEYAALLGVSRQTVRAEIASGDLRAYRVRTGDKRNRRRQYRIAWAEARRHAKQLGILLTDR